MGKTQGAKGYHPSFLKILALVNGQFPPSGDVGLPDDPLADIVQVAIYTRLSRQDDKSHSPLTQLTRCRETARYKDWTVLREFTQDADEPISGKAFEGRPGWDALESFVKQLQAKERSKTSVLVKSFDRFSRNTEEGLRTARVLYNDLGIRIRSCDMLMIAPEDEVNGKMFFAQDLMRAEAERAMIVRRTRDGLKTAQLEGKVLGGRAFPNYFHKDDDGRIVPDPKAMQVAQLRSQGQSYIAIGRQTGLTSNDAYHICEFLSKTKARIAARGQQ